jgi:cytochrome P450
VTTTTLADGDLRIPYSTSQHAASSAHNRHRLDGVRLAGPEYSFHTLGIIEVRERLVADLYYDPYDVEIDADPYPVYERLRDEAPCYYNERYDFWAVSRFEDCRRGLADAKHYISGRGSILELVKANIEMPTGTLIFEDPPVHTVHRSLLSRVFTPRRVAALEPQIRESCARSLDPLAGANEFDLVADFAVQMPMRVIGLLFGIPEADQEAIRQGADANLRTEAGQPMEVSQVGPFPTDMLAEYIDWRIEHPSDDLMTDLLNAEFEDETGTVRRLSRDEALLYTTVVAGAGSETTTRLIGWAAKVLAEHPDQCRELVEDRLLIPNAIEELLRYEAPGPHIARYLPNDVELYGQIVPAGSALLFVVAAANRDERRYEDPDRFDIRRDVGQHLAFGYGIHFCLGASLARLEGRIALDELLGRIPEWDVDLGRARLASTSTVWGWETLPVIVPWTSGFGRGDILGVRQERVTEAPRNAI